MPARLAQKDDIVVVPGKGGFGIDACALRDRDRRVPAEPIEVAVGPQHPPVSDDAAAAAREHALALVGRPSR